MRRKRTLTARLLAGFLSAAMIVTGTPVTTLAAPADSGILNDYIPDEDEGLYEEATPSDATPSDATPSDATPSDATALSEGAREFVRRVEAIDREKLRRLAAEYVAALRHQSAVSDEEDTDTAEWEAEWADACAQVLEKETAFGAEWEPVLNIETEAYEPLSDADKETDEVKAAYQSYKDFTAQIERTLYATQANSAEISGEISTSQTWYDGDVISGAVTITGGTEEAPVVIRVLGTVTQKATIEVTSGYVTFTGGTLLRDGSFTTKEMLNIHNDGANVTLENITVDGGNVECTNQYARGISVNRGTTLNIEDGVVLQNHKIVITKEIYGVALSVQGATVTMNGGTIRDNYGESGTPYGIVYTKVGSTFTMNGGMISNNTLIGLDSNTYIYGGIVYCGAGKFYMNGGSIRDNTVGRTESARGGGVHIASGGAGYLYGGEIAGNTATGKGDGVFYSASNFGSWTQMYIGGDLYVPDTIYLGTLMNNEYLYITAPVKNVLNLQVDRATEGRKIAVGSDDYTLTEADLTRIRVVDARGRKCFLKLDGAGYAVLTMTDPGYTKKYYVTYHPNGGNGITVDNTAYDAGNSATIKGNSFTYTCHEFTGWNTDATGGGAAYAAGATVPMNDSLNLYAQWNAKHTGTAVQDGGTGYYYCSDCGALLYSDTARSYKVVYYLENAEDNGYTKVGSDVRTGTIGRMITITPPTYAGFTCDEGASTLTHTPTTDDSTVAPYKEVAVKYKRNTYTLTWNANGGTVSGGTAAGEVKWGAPITAPTVTKAGCTSSGWSPEVPDVMPKADATYTAQWPTAIDSVDPQATPVAGEALVTTPDTAAEGYTTSISWSPADSTAKYKTVYTATATLTADANHIFPGSVTAADGWHISSNTGSVLTLTRTFDKTRLAKLTSLASPSDLQLNAYCATASDAEAALQQLVPTVPVEVEDHAVTKMAIDWKVDGTYNPAPSEQNTFIWTVKSTAYQNDGDPIYDVSGTEITGRITVTNMDAIPVNHTAVSKEITYDGSTYDVTTLFTLDPNAGEATYTIAPGGTGAGTLDGTMLTITEVGTINIRVDTAMRTTETVKYAAGNATSTLTVTNPRNDVGPGSITITIPDPDGGEDKKYTGAGADENGNITITLPPGAALPTTPGQVEITPPSGATVTGPTTSDGGHTWTYEITSEDGTKRETYTVIINVPPSISADLSDQRVVRGKTATFKVEASGTPAPAYRWQVSKDGGRTWTDITGATGASYTTPAAASGMNGWQYRCVVSNEAGEIISNPATLKLVLSGGGSSGGGSSSGGPGGPGGAAGSSTIYASPDARAMGGNGYSDGQWQLIDEQARKWVYILKDGNRAKSGWMYIYNPYSTDGQKNGWFCFDDEGIMRVGWIAAADGTWRFCQDMSDGNFGRMVRGWYQDPADRSWYYLEETTGIMQSGWAQIGGKWYYFATASDAPNQSWKYDEAAGKLVQTQPGRRSYGAMYQNETTPDGYAVDENGAWVR